MRNVLIADDHEVTRRGIRQLVADAFADATITETQNGAGVLALLETKDWDLLLIDVMMPGISVVQLLQAIRAVNALVPVLMITGSTETEYVVQTMKAGANGLVHKHRAADDLLGAMKVVASGGKYLDTETALALAARLGEGDKTLPHQTLSARELEIFCLLARGRSVKEIAAELYLSDKTVATYLARIREKTRLTSHVEIARYALQHGLVD